MFLFWCIQFPDKHFFSRNMQTFWTTRGFFTMLVFRYIFILTVNNSPFNSPFVFTFSFRCRYSTLSNSRFSSDSIMSSRFCLFNTVDHHSDSEQLRSRCVLFSGSSEPWASTCSIFPKQQRWSSYCSRLFLLGQIMAKTVLTFLEVSFIAHKTL